MPPTRISCSKDTMKILLIALICSMALAAGVLAQGPTPPQPPPSPAGTAASPALSASVSPTASAGSSDLGNRIEQRLQKKFKHGFHIGVDTDDSKEGDHN